MCGNAANTGNRGPPLLSIFTFLWVDRRADDMDRSGIRDQRSVQILLKTIKKSKATSTSVWMEAGRRRRHSKQGKSGNQRCPQRSLRCQTRRTLWVTQTQYLLKEMLTVYRLQGGSWWVSGSRLDLSVASKCCWLQSEVSREASGLALTALGLWVPVSGKTQGHIILSRSPLGLLFWPTTALFTY